MYDEFDMVKSNFIIFLLLLVVTLFFILITMKYNKLFKIILFSLAGIELVYGILIGVAAYKYRPLTIGWEDVYDINYHELVDLITERYECDREIYFAADYYGRSNWSENSGIRVNAKTGRIQEVDEKLSGGIAPFVQHLYVPYKGKYYSAELILEENIFKTKMKCYLYREFSDSSSFYENNDAVYNGDGGYISGSMIKENDFYSHIYADYYEYMIDIYKNANIDYFDLNISFIPAKVCSCVPDRIELNTNYIDRKFIRSSEIVKMYVVDYLGSEKIIDENYQEGFYVIGTCYFRREIVLYTKVFIVAEK